MALDRAIYKAFEQVVGKRNISEDPGVLETYRCIAAQSSAHYGPYDHKTPTPQAVVMPGSTKEVQGCIRLCNKYGIHFKASTTFWSAHGYIDDDYSIQFDMHRMKNFSIDAKNMTMTVEPYVIAGTAQAEAMRYGLTCNIPGVGCSSSLVANVSGWGGPGPSSVYTGSAAENLLCFEWVLPNGDIIHTGSESAGLAGFTDEGPGPALRALLRSGGGLRGEFGICTRITFKLSPWPGPSEMTTEGHAPAYFAKLPDNIRAFTLCFPDWDRWGKAMMLLCESDIIFAGHRQFSMFGRDIKAAMLEILIDPDKQLCDIEELNKLESVQKTNKSIKIEMYVVVAGMTKEDMDWKLAALNKIVEMYDGWFDERCNQKDLEEWMQSYFIRMGHKNLNYTLCGSYEGTFGLNGGNLLYSASIAEEAVAVNREWEEKDTFIARIGGDSSMGGLSAMGGGQGPMLWEFFAHFDAHDKKSISGLRNFIDNVSTKFQREHDCPGPEFCRCNQMLRKESGYGFTQEEMNEIYKKMPDVNPYIYQFKVQKLFNPNDLTGSYYPRLDPASL